MSEEGTNTGGLGHESIAVRRGEDERVEDRSAEVRAEFHAQRKLNTSTDSTYVPYQKAFTAYCQSQGYSEAVTAQKMLAFLMYMIAKKTPQRKGKSIKGGKAGKAAGEAPTEVKMVEYAYKTIKTIASAVVDLWTQQKGVQIVYQGQCYCRGELHPRQAEVKQLLATHRVSSYFLIILHLCVDEFASLHLHSKS